MSMSESKKDETKVKTEKKPHKFEGTYLVQIELPELKETMAKFAATIDKDDLLDDPDVNKGRTIETDTHITVHLGGKLYSEDFKNFFKSAKPFPVTIEGLGSFSNEDRKFDDGTLHSFDVLFANASGDLHTLNQIFVDETSVQNDFEYSPHVTIAYLKYGKADKYIKANTMPATKIMVDALKFSKFQDRTSPAEIIHLHG